MPSIEPIPPHPMAPRSVGAAPLDDGRCNFRVWATNADSVELHITEPDERRIPMTQVDRGYFEVTVDDCSAGATYFYRVNDGDDRPDPASRYQPHGVHHASAVVSPHFDWTDAAWSGIPLNDYITYELHVGTFTEAGTFDEAIHQLDDLKHLGITAIELLPVAQFPGDRNWGYDGVHPFAVQNSYGGPDGLRRFVDAAHARGIAVIMDVVYNHLGPEGNYLGEFALYFTPKYSTPWGSPLNFDGPHSDEVRRYFIENALHWIEEYHIDALRLDAVHAIYDFSAYPFLQELADAVRLQGKRLGRQVFTIAESALNDRRMITSKREGGFGIDAQWADDLHHCLHVLLTGERGGYYEDYNGFDDLVSCLRHGYTYTGAFSEYRKRRYGNDATDIAPERFVVFNQNHDQVGNRMLGERFSTQISHERQKLAAAMTLLSPYSPMLFMGEDYADPAPFMYFVSHSDPGLIEGVREGRKREFEQFHWDQEPPDPQAEETFRKCILDHSLKGDGWHAALRSFYRRLIEIRKSSSVLRYPDRERFRIVVLEPGQVVALIGESASEHLAIVMNFGEAQTTVSAALSAGKWTTTLDSNSEEYQGNGRVIAETLQSRGRVAIALQPLSVVVMRRNV